MEKGFGNKVSTYFKGKAALWSLPATQKALK
jgi:hypothetical protein